MMAAKKFSKREAINFGWATFKNNAVFLLGILLASAVIPIIPQLIGGYLPGMGIIFLLISGFLQILVGMGLIKVTLKFCDNEKAEFADLFSCSSLFLRYLAGSILYAIIVLIGLCLLVVPGVIWAIQFQFFTYLIVDKGMGPVEALEKSSAITKGAKWDLFLFGILLELVVVAGILALLVGILAALPVVMLANAFVYRKLAAQLE